MKTTCSLLAALALGMALAVPAHAHGGGGHVGIYLGGPIGWPYYYPYYGYGYGYPYYYPPAVVQPSSPPVYIERQDTQEAAPSTSYWYYCPESKAYYPYVKQCPGGWQRVAPQPPE
ncbi:MAG: hypothetical protein WCA09_04920 [Burkholderiales bacterium]